MGKPTGYLVEVKGVGFVPLCLTTGKRDARLYAAYQTADGPGKHEFPAFVDNPEDLRDLGYATLQARGPKRENPAKTGKSPAKVAEKSPEKPEETPKANPKEKDDYFDELL